jgi:toxin HigB-1
MIRSFKDGVTEALFEGRRPKGFPPEALNAARRKLAMIHAAARLATCASRPETGWRRFPAIGPGNIRSE